jgi:hypothetical protein
LDFSLRSTAVWLENHSELTSFPRNKILSSVLVSESVSSDDDWLGPARDQSWNVIDDDWFSEHSAVKLISDGSVWTLPHLL